MRRVSLLLASVFFASALLGCPLLKKKKGGDGDEDLSDAATVNVSGTGANNEGNVLRYAQEELITELAVIGKDGTVARNFPGNGPQVAVLAKGTVVMKMAKYFSTGVLVMFDDPLTQDGTKLMGWVPINAFDVAAPKPVWIPPKIVDAGPKVTPDAGGGGSTTTDAGGGTGPKDAGGGTAAVDAGGSSGGIPQPKPGTVAVQPVNGKCPDNWAVHNAMCRRVCKADTECPRGTKCKPGGGSKICTAD